MIILQVQYITDRPCRQRPFGRVRSGHGGGRSFAFEEQKHIFRPGSAMRVLSGDQPKRKCYSIKRKNMKHFGGFSVYIGKTYFREEIGMKKIISAALCLILVLSFVGCGTRSTGDQPSVTAVDQLNDPGELDVSEGNAGTIREDVCELYLEVLEDLWNVDPGLNSEISQIGIDLSELSHLTEAEKDSVMSEFASKHNLPYLAGTWEELCEQGFIDKENLCWKEGLFFSIKTNEDAVWNLPAIKEGDPVPELTAFDAQKWRSGLGAYFFGQCSAQKNADGKWSYTVGQEAIS